MSLLKPRMDPPLLVDMELHARKPSIPRSGRPVLVLDSAADAAPREALARGLTRWGYPVLVACDSLAAIHMCEEVRPCLIVLGETTDEQIDTSTLLHEIADILYEDPPPVALLIRELRSPRTRAGITLSPLLFLEDLLDGADERCAA